MEQLLKECIDKHIIDKVENDRLSGFITDICKNEDGNIILYNRTMDALGKPKSIENVKKPYVGNKTGPIPYERSFASHDRSKFWSKKNEKSATEYAISSGKKAWFSCDCGHDFESRIASISDGRWCSFCCIPPQKLCDNEDCDQCYTLSFASHSKAIFWNKNNDTTPRKVFLGSHKIYKFDCDICFHTFEQSPNHISGYSCWCNYCASSILCDTESCEKCHEKSFNSHEKAKFWSKKNEGMPRQFFKGSPVKFWFTCNVCNHDFDMSLGHITCENKWCPYCGNVRLCNSESCENCHNRSFANNDMAQFWSKKNVESPRMVFRSSGKKYIFDCFLCGNEYETTPNNIVDGKWCNCTINKTETKLYDYLKTMYNDIIIEKQKRFDWCKRQKNLPFDFCMEQYKLIIELDGDQHFDRQISNWDSPEVTREGDKYKMIQAKNHGYSIIRITQHDVWRDKNDWRKSLNDAVVRVKANVGNPVIIFIGKKYETDFAKMQL